MGIHWSSFRRACRFGGPSSWRRLAYLSGAASAIPSVLLVFNVGILVDLLLRRNCAPAVLETSLEPWLDSSALGWLVRQTDEIQLLVLLVSLIVLAVLESLLLLLHTRSVVRAATDTTQRVNLALYEQVARLSAGVGLLCSQTEEDRRLQHDIDHLRQTLIVWWQTLPRSVGLLVLLTVLGMVIDPSLTLLAVLLAVFVWRLYQRTRANAERRAAGYLEQAAKRSDTLLDTFHTARIVSAVSPPTSMIDTFLAALQRYRSDVLRAACSTERLRPLVFLCLAFSMALILLVVGLSPRSSSLRLIILALVYARMFVPALRLSQAFDAAQQTDSAASRIFDVLDATPQIGQVAGAVDMSRLSSELRWDNVALQGPDGLSLIRHVSMTLPAGARVAWVADEPDFLPSLVQVCLRYRDPEAGRILYDDVDARSLTLNSLRSGTAFVDFCGGLFTGTIFENIHCGRTGCLNEDVEQAAQLCGILDAIQNLPMGFHTNVGHMVRDLPPALEFRIGVARAVVSDPSLLVIDEPKRLPEDSSGVSYDDLLDRLGKNRTLIVLATQLPTLRTSNTVFVFRQGRLHAEGEHAQLLQKDAFYRHLNYLLFNAFQE